VAAIRWSGAAGRLLAAAALFLAGAAYGGAAVRYGLFPWPDLQWRYRRLRPAAEPPRVELALLTLRTPADVERRRRELIRLIWGKDALPSRGPDSVEAGAGDPRFADLPGVARAERLRVRMDFGIDSTIVHLVPERPNGTLVLVHGGHGDDLALSDAIGRLIERGYAVAAFAMPLYGGNSRPAVRAGQLGRIVLDNHDKLRLVQPAEGLAEQYLLEPVPVVLNRLAPLYRSVAMVGLSGGGWTTTLAAALDPRISKSFPVAGSSPPDIAPAGVWPEFEQSDPALYARFSYLDLYTLGAAGRGRRQLQILNEYDDCCFAGRGAESYSAAVAARARRLGGRYDLLIDSTHSRHQLSPWAMERILAGLAS
jgi:alpha-beta hydrolase superfamily lysophospholipase